MFISFLYPYKIRNIEAPFLWVLYKQITHFSPENIAFIGTKDYFMDLEHFASQDRWEVRADSAVYNEYIVPSKTMMAQYKKYVIEDDFFKELEEHYNDSNNLVWKELLLNRNVKLEEKLTAILEECIRTYDCVEAILTWCNVPSLQYIAKKFNISVIHNEIGPLRKPFYKNTAYFDFSGVNGRTECQARFEKFKKDYDNKNINVPVLSPKEILEMFSKREDSLEFYETKYDVGIALQVEDDSNMLAFAKDLNNFELIQIVYKHFDKNRTLIRKHPSGHLQYDKLVGNIDNSPTAATFIKQCRKVCTINSSVGLESLLHGKETYILGDNPFAFIASNKLKDLCGKADIDCLALNFAMFGYVIPYELLFDIDYYKWRLTFPTEDEIYNYHLQYYLNEYSDVAIADLSVPNNLMVKLLRRKNNQINEQLLLSRLRYQELEKRYQELESSHQELEKRQNSIPYKWLNLLKTK